MLISNCWPDAKKRVRRDGGVLVYSASFSGNFRGSFWRCARLFGDYLGVIWEVFCEDFEGKTIQRVREKSAKTVFFTI